MIHILKIKGTGKIPDFVQIRDENLSLKAYFRADQIDRGFKKNEIEDPSGKLKDNSFLFNIYIQATSILLPLIN